MDLVLAGQAEAQAVSLARQAELEAMHREVQQQTVHLQQLIQRFEWAQAPGTQHAELSTMQQLGDNALGGPAKCLARGPQPCGAGTGQPFMLPGLRGHAPPGPYQQQQLHPSALGAHTGLLGGPAPGCTPPPIESASVGPLTPQGQGGHVTDAFSWRQLLLLARLGADPKMIEDLASGNWAPPHPNNTWVGPLLLPGQGGGPPLGPYQQQQHHPSALGAGPGLLGGPAFAPPPPCSAGVGPLLLPGQGGGAPLGPYQQQQHSSALGADPGLLGGPAFAPLYYGTTCVGPLLLPGQVGGAPLGPYQQQVHLGMDPSHGLQSHGLPSSGCSPHHQLQQPWAMGEDLPSRDLASADPYAEQVMDGGVMRPSSPVSPVAAPAIPVSLSKRGRPRKKSAKAAAATAAIAEEQGPTFSRTRAEREAALASACERITSQRMQDAPPRAPASVASVDLPSRLTADEHAGLNPVKWAGSDSAAGGQCCGALGDRQPHGTGSATISNSSHSPCRRRACVTREAATRAPG